MAPAQVEELLQDPESTSADERLKAAMALVREYTKYQGELEPLRTALLRLQRSGVSQEGIDDVLALAHHFNFINRLADAFDFSLPEQGERRLATMLDVAKMLLRLPRPDPFLREEPVLAQALPQEFLSGRDSLLQGAGQLPKSTRAAMEGHCASERGARRPKLDLPAQCDALALKMSQCAYKIVDEDFEALRAHGYDDQEIFELVLCAAWGASSAALEAAYAILQSLHRANAGRVGTASTLEPVPS